MIPQIIYLSIAFIGLLYVANQHGKPKIGTYNIFTQLVGVALSMALLYFGGFFDVFFK